MVKKGIRSRLANRHATESQDCSPHRSLHAAALTGPQPRQPVKLPGIVAVAGILNVNLTSAGRTERKTNWQRRATNHTSVKLRKYAQRIGPAVSGTLTYRGGVYEKLRYADV